MNGKLHERLGRNSRVMRKIDNMEDTYTDSREIYKPKGTNNYSLDNMYGEEFNGSKRRKGISDSLPAKVVILAIIVMGIIIFEVVVGIKYL